MITVCLLHFLVVRRQCHCQVLGAVLAHGPERDVLPLRTIVSNIAVKQIVVPAIGACALLAPSAMQTV